MTLDKFFKIVVFIFLLFSVQLSKSQVVIGLQNNHAGSRSLSLNPSLMSTSHLYFDVALANVGLLAFNDYAYVESSDLMNAIFTKDYVMPRYFVNGKDAPFNIYDFKSRRSRSFYQSLDLNIISLMYNLNGKQSLGFALNSRVYTSGDNISWQIPLIMTFGIKGVASMMSSSGDSTFYENLYAEDIKITSLEWNEASFSFASMIHERNFSRVDIGVSLKYLMGYSAVALDVDRVDYNVLNDDTVYMNYADGDAMYSLPINYEKPFSQGMGMLDNSLQRGSGFAFDVGFTYTHKKDARRTSRNMSSCLLPKMKYNWRLGVSIMDVGFINFNKNVINNHFFTDETVLFDKNVIKNVKSLAEMNEYMRMVFDNADTVASDFDKFTIGLPTTLRVHFDYNIKKEFYVSAVVVQPIKLFKYSVIARPQLVVEPRYESSFFDFSLPLSLKDYRFFSVGAMARIGFLTIGTYNIANYLGLGDANGLDIYISIKFNFKKGRCRDRYDACWSADFGNKYYR